MTWESRAKLFGGVVAVILIVALCTAVFLQRQSHVVSTSAQISAETYDVGTDYSGYVTKQFVKVGDTVAKGDDLFSVKSLSVLDFTKSKVKTAASGSYTVTSDGTMTFTAPVAGTVSRIDTMLGSFVEGGTLLTTIDEAGSLLVVGDYSITPRDYERIDDGAAVDLELPDRTTVHGTVKKISVQTLDGIAETEIEVDSPSLDQGGHGGLVTPGTPVTATLYLHEQGPVKGIQTAISGLLANAGL